MYREARCLDTACVNFYVAYFLALTNSKSGGRSKNLATSNIDAEHIYSFTQLICKCSFDLTKIVCIC